MAISYKPLFQTMKAKGITSYKLEKMGFSRTNYYSIKNGNAINTTTLDSLCKYLNCSVNDVLEYIPDEEIEKATKEATDDYN